EPQAAAGTEYYAWHPRTASLVRGISLRARGHRLLWLQRKRLRAFLKNSLWIAPVGGMLAALVVAPVTRHLNSVTPFRFFDFGLEGARAAVGVIAASMLSFVVFFFSVL